ALLREKDKGGEGRMLSTAKVRLQFLKTALNWAVKQKLLPEAPEFPTVKPPKKRPQPVPTEVVERLLAQAGDPELEALLLCCWLAGLRRNEAHDLEREPTDRAPWVDFSRDRIWLPAEYVKAVEDQWVPLDPALKAALLALPERDSRFFHLT